MARDRSLGEAMKARAWVVSVVAALAGVALLRVYMHRYEQEVAGGPSTSVLVLTRDVGGAATLARDMLGTRELPQAYLESRHVRARDLDQVLGAALGVPARAGEALLWTDLATLRERARAVSELVPEGMRAVTLARAPGDRVDVLLSQERDVAAHALNATLVAENLLVLAIGGETATAASGTRAATQSRRNGGVTVSVTPEQSLRLAAAERAGSLRLVLRNPDDLAVGTVRP
jgi:pilus assembly protein CpaB